MTMLSKEVKVAGKDATLYYHIDGTGKDQRYGFSHLVVKPEGFIISQVQDRTSFGLSYHDFDEKKGVLLLRAHSVGEPQNPFQPDNIMYHVPITEDA